LFKTILIIILFNFGNHAWAQQTCSRIAIINYQEVLVDSNSTQKGEGLRFHLEKDEVAKSFLNKYQEGSNIRWENAAMGTAATGLVLTSFMSNAEGNSKKALLIGGVALFFVNFLVARTLENENEKNLIKAIDEYNSRNLPRIHFNLEPENSRNPSSSTSFSLSKSWSF
jgi:hypothetical protein